MQLQLKILIQLKVHLTRLQMGQLLIQQQMLPILLIPQIQRILQPLQLLLQFMHHNVSLLEM